MIFVNKQKQHKYLAKPVYYHPTLDLICKSRQTKDAIYFDSTFEYRVFRELVNLAGFNNVDRQVPLLVKPGTKSYSSLHWKCDFRVYKSRDSNEYLNIEAKGMLTPEFKRNLQYLEYFGPGNFEKLIVIADKSYWVDKCVQTWELKEALTYLKNKGY